MSRIFGRTLVTLCAACLVLSTASAEELPRYRLKAGMELTYHYSSEFKYGTGAKAGVDNTKTDWHVWVLRQNADGSWRLLLRESALFFTNKKGTGNPARTLACCDLFPDARLGPDASLGYTLDPTTLFPCLPPDAATAAKGWEGYFKRDLVRNRYTCDAKASEAGKSFVFTGIRETPLDKIYLTAEQTTFTYDPGRGLVVKSSGMNSLGYGPLEGKGTFSLELKDVKDASDNEIRQLATESERYFSAAKTYEDLTSQASMRADSKELLTKAAAVLKDVRRKLTHPLLQQQADNQLKQHARLAKSCANAGAERAALLGKPAAEWETKDLDGKSAALKDYRGKVVVLDFWYRGCGPCMRAMPQVGQVADEFRGESVAVLGMNTDKKEEDARLVVKKMGLRYPVLKAEGLPEKYHVRGFPTLIIIDGKGTVRDIHVGYSPTLRQEVSTSIRKLLAEAKTAAK